MVSWQDLCGWEWEKTLGRCLTEITLSPSYSEMGVQRLAFMGLSAAVRQGLCPVAVPLRLPCNFRAAPSHSPDALQFDQPHWTAQAGVLQIIWAARWGQITRHLGCGIRQGCIKTADNHRRRGGLPPPSRASSSKHASAPADTKMGHIQTLRPELSPQRRQSPEPCRCSPTLTPFRAEGRDKNRNALSA